MTNEEAIKIFESWASVKYNPTTDAAKLAISALRAQEKEHIGDVTEMTEPCGWCNYFIEEVKLFYVSEYDDDKQYYRFCPMCGRPLNTHAIVGGNK